MAHVIRGTTNPLKDNEKAQYFHRAMELNFSFGAECLRELTKKYLKDKNVTVKDHLNEPFVKRELSKLHLFPDQKQILNNPDPNLSAMDVTFLNILLLKTFPHQLTPFDKSCIEKINDKRTQLSHLAQAELEDNTLFNEYSQLILAISRSIDRAYNDNMVTCINELRRKELVRTCSDVDKIQINNEVYMLKLVEASSRAEVDQDSQWRIKYGLTKWTRQLSIGLEVTDFLKLLKSEGVVSDTEKRNFEMEYSYECQMRLLILHMVQTGTKDSLYKMCQCLRQMSPILANVVEGSDSNGQEIEKYLRKRAKTKIRSALEAALIERANESVPTEDIHIYCEKTLKDRFEFSLIRKCLLKEFKHAQNTLDDSRFFGVAWMTHTATQFSKDDSVQEEENTDLHDLSCEEFAQYTGNLFQRRSMSLGNIFRTAVIEESISATTFVDMTYEQLKNTFTPYLGSIKYGVGIEMDLKKLQWSIKDSATNVIPAQTNTEILRTFEKPVENRHYKNAVVRPAAGNLLVPQHVFIHLPTNKMYTNHFIVKEVVRFTAACINGRKNGTIYFGIKHLQQGFGRIFGIPVNNRIHIYLDNEINRSLSTCFEENVSVAKRCVRPVQIVPVEGGENVVIEVDIVPYSVHLSEEVLHVKFPPKGFQSRKWFIFDCNEIVPVSSTRLNDVREACAQILKQRAYLEKEKLKDDTYDNHLQRKLKQLLTRGNKYVTDELLPIIISGRISGSPNENEIRKALDIDRAVTSSELVLDFDSSVELREKVEENKISFSIKTAENVLQGSKQKNEVADQPEPQQTWLYCNGNNELENPFMQLRDWMRERLDGVKKALGQMRQAIPKHRGILVFLIFDVPSHYQEPLFEIAREALLSLYRDECIVISDKEENITYLKNEVVRVFGESAVDSCFVTGLDWTEISRVMNTVFRVNADVICKLPCSKGHFVEMTLKEKDDLKLTDIEILSGEQCLHEEERMKDIDRRIKRRESQENFYKGGDVTWWNFYYQTQVGKRTLFDLHKSEIKVKVSNEKGEGLIDVQEIEHHPGAGGSTLGRHLIWDLSQFKGDPERAYRCLVVHTITDETVNQIDRFRMFKDADDTKPFILLIDNRSEEDVILLRTKLHELAYKTATPGKLFCLIIIVSRIPITYVKKKGKHLLKHELSIKEQNWFEDKYREMEQGGDIDVKTLIAFNFMRKSFSRKYIQDTTHGLMKGISKKELDVLKCLSLISIYESDHPVPQTVFDEMMKDQFDMELILRQPFGIAHHMKELESLAKFTRRTWNVEMTDAMHLLLTKREHKSFYNSGVCIVSQLLAKAILDYIMKAENMSLENIVNFVLDFVEEQSTLKNTMSKKFVKIVCSLFKTRQLMDSEKGEAKLKFSDLILELEQPAGSEIEEVAWQRVVRVMQRCFDITDDAMVGQQLARFNIHIKEFNAAETAIQRSLTKRPQSSYLLDTYGQIFKAKMEFLLETCQLSESKIPNSIAAEIIEQALTAVQKFKDGQTLSIRHDEDTNWSCFHMEVKTTLNLLEKFSKFSCYINRELFLNFLNEADFKTDGSSFADIMTLCPSLDSIRFGREFQQHVETSLRSLEEIFYQVKGHLYAIYTENEVLLLKLRERFERYYGSTGKRSHYKFLYGIGLKPLQQAKEKTPDILEKRVKESEENLQRKKLSEVDKRDLMVYLGTRIISLSNQPDGSEKCKTNEYKLLLSCSTELVNKQMSVNVTDRPYLESFLYFAMLHWPLQSRIKLNLEELSGPKTYMQHMVQWESAFNSNFFLKTMDQVRRHKPKNYFVLAKGSPGNDILDLESIRKEWREKKKDTGRLRKPVYRDNFWKESFVVQKLERLHGIMDESGLHILHKVEYLQHGTQTFKINTYYPCATLSNRSVTFVLGFTWKGPTALDVDEKDFKVKRNTNQRVEYNVTKSSSIETEDNGADLDSSPTRIMGATGKTEACRVVGADTRIVEWGLGTPQTGGDIQAITTGEDEDTSSGTMGATGTTVTCPVVGADTKVVEWMVPLQTPETFETQTVTQGEKGATASGGTVTENTDASDKGKNKRPVWMKTPKKKKTRKK